MKSSFKIGCFSSASVVAGALAGTLLLAASGSAVAMPGWAYIASETGLMDAPNGALVRYGDYDPASCDMCLGRWNYQYIQGNGIPCTNATFTDPWVGRYKRCEKMLDNNNLADAPWDYKVVAKEGEPLNNNFVGRTLYYGMFSSAGAGIFVREHVVVSGDKCDNDAFGDPLPGVVKVCFQIQTTDY